MKTKVWKRSIFFPVIRRDNWRKWTALHHSTEKDEQSYLIRLGFRSPRSLKVCAVRNEYAVSLLPPFLSYLKRQFPANLPPYTGLHLTYTQACSGLTASVLTVEAACFKGKGVSVSITHRFIPQLNQLVTEVWLKANHFPAFQSYPKGDYTVSALSVRISNTYLVTVRQCSPPPPQKREA